MHPKKELFIKAGSPILLTCKVVGCPGLVLPMWYKGSKVSSIQKTKNKVKVTYYTLASEKCWWMDNNYSRVSARHFNEKTSELKTAASKISLKITLSKILEELYCKSELCDIKYSDVVLVEFWNQNMNY